MTEKDVAEIYLSNEAVPLDIQEIAQALGKSYDLDYELGQGLIVVSRDE